MEKLMPRYNQNLSITDTNVLSYGTKVGTFDHEKKVIVVTKWYSVTTSKHINYVASEMGYSVEKMY